jgi:hypothetical protein
MQLTGYFSIFWQCDNADKSAIMEAKLKIEDILDHINSVSVYDSHGTFHLIHMDLFK